MNWDLWLSQLIDGNDSLKPEVERLVKAPKVAVDIVPKGRRHSVPNELVLRVRPVEGHLRSLKVLGRKAGGQWYIDLVTDRGDVIRKYHYHYSGHLNPDGTVTGQSHKHVPTEKYPLLESHKDIETWAYDPEPFPYELVKAVKHFCKECNIELVALQERLDWR